MKPWKNFWGAMLLCLLLLASCGEPNEVRTVLNTADSLLADGQPDSALSLLEPILPRVPSFPKSQRMRYHLLRTQAQNKCDTVFRSDSVIRTVANYYDRHGTPNDRMLAHYLLGRALSDMGESPEALQAFHDAADRADTTAADCDYATLSRIYAQTANIFYYQNMFKEQLQALNSFSYYALKDKDTVTSMIAYISQAYAYDLLNKKDSALTVIRIGRDKLKALGCPDIAAQNCILLINDYVEKKQFDEARVLIDEYEQQSGFFDSTHHIMSGKELFFYDKGNYYMGIQRTDSAYLMFKNCFDNAVSAENRHAACMGLARLFRETNEKDSMAKYAMLASAYNDTVQLQTSTGTLQQMQSMYDYTRHQAEAEKHRILAEKNRKKNFIFGTIALVVFIAGVYVKMSSERKRIKLQKDFHEKLDSLSKQKEELSILMERKKDDFQQLIERKKKDISELEQQIDILREKQDLHNSPKVFLKYQSSDVYKRFLFYSTKPTCKPSLEDWEQLHVLADKMTPNLYPFLVGKHKLKLKDYDLCVLSLMGFKTNDLANFFDLDKSTVSTKYRRISQKVSGKSMSSKELIDFLMQIS